MAGRLAARRGQGRVAFLDLDDRSGRIQLWATADRLGDEAMAALLDLDLGDIVGAAGPVARTRRGELSVRRRGRPARQGPAAAARQARRVRDPEIRFRQRYLDLMSDPGAREAFRSRARPSRPCAASSTQRGFVEVETPTLQPIYGGAAARPFVTHHNVLDRDLYLRIATELYLKRLIVGGLEKVYELGKDFRNEGVSHKHNPEFTMVETYEAYADYRDVMEMLEQMVATLAPRRPAARRCPGRGARSTSRRRGGGRLPRRAARGERHRRARARRRGLAAGRDAGRRPRRARRRRPGRSSWTGSSPRPSSRP